MKHFFRIPVACLLVLLLFAGSMASAQVHTARPNANISSRCKGYYEYLPQGYDPAGTATYPMIIFFTGIGEFGNGSSSHLTRVLKNGPPKLIQAGTFPTSFSVLGQTFKFIVITPQFTATPVVAADVDSVVRYMTAKYKVNLNRVYLTGLSYGGGLCFAYAGNHNTSYGARIAAIVPTATPMPLPIETGYDTIYARSRVIAAANIPVWATHNSGDTPDSAARTIAYINNINQAPAPNPLAKATIISAGGHDSWTKTYDPEFRDAGYNLYEWMLLYQKGSAPPPANLPPTVNNVADKIISLPANSVTVTATGSDPESGPITYNWIQVYGPAAATITAPTSGTTSFSSLVQGYYKFRVYVSDNKGAKATDDVKVTVNPALATGSKLIQVNVYGGSSAYSSSVWNNWSVGLTAGTDKTSAAFKYTDGSLSAVTAVLSRTIAISDNGTSYSGGVTAPEVLRHASYDTVNRTLTLNGLSLTKKYNLEFYASRGTTTAGSTVFVVGGTSVSVNAVNNFTTKAVFQNIVPNASGQIVVNINRATLYNYLNGFTIMENNLTPSTTRSSSALQVITEASGAKAVQVFPNPVTNSITLQLQSNYRGAVQVRLTDVAGRVQQAWRFVKNSQTMQQHLPVDGVSKGMYFITVQTGLQRQTLPVSKIK